MNNLKKKLNGLKLAGMAMTLETRHEYALSNKLSYAEFLELIIEDEYSNRSSNSFTRRYSKSRLANEKTIQSYDFSYQPELDRKLVSELASCRFIKEKKNIILMGNPGVGKTHLANAFGIEALKLGHKAIFTHASGLVEKLYSSRGDGTYSNTLRIYTEADLLIIDELGFKKISQNNVDEFFEIIRTRYEKGSIIITTNRSFEDWGQIFGDAVLASAIIDRLVHHAYVIKITGPSYRVKDYMKTAKPKKTSSVHETEN